MPHRWNWCASWFFPGFAKGHILELDGRSGVVSPWGDSTHVPIFERWFLGGLYSLRGYKYQTVGPEDGFGEPLGGDTYFFGTAEYSIPIIKIVRFACCIFTTSINVYPDPFNVNPGPNRAFYTGDARTGPAHRPAHRQGHSTSAGTTAFPITPDPSLSTFAQPGSLDLDTRASFNPM